MRSPLIQYLVGLLVNLLYILILISDQTSYQNIQLPENDYSENLWKGTDVLTYVGPARNFINYQVFGYEAIPGYSRTIGYPLFLSMSMKIFGTNWLIFTLFAHAAIFALVYPLLSAISNILFSASDRSSISAFWFFIFSGTYIVRVPVIMTDTFFTVFFTLGLWLGLESIVKRSYILLLLHIIFVGYAAQVRPILSLYPFINCLILASTAVKYNFDECSKVRRIIIASFVCLLITCNLPTIRNYINYGFPRPTRILSQDMFQQLGRRVLIDVGKSGEFEEMQKMLQGIDDIRLKASLQEKLAVKIYQNYPLTTSKIMLRNAIGILGRAHWPVAANFWGYNFQDNLHPAYMPLKRSKAIYLIEIFFNIIYLIVYFLFLCFLVRIFRSENIIFPLTIILIVIYFLTPTFVESGAGGRYRLPVEGLIVTMASCEFDRYLGVFKKRLAAMINNMGTIARVLRAYLKNRYQLQDV